MDNLIGKTIGVQTDNFSVTNDAGETVKIRVNIDYSNMTDLDIMNCLNGNRRIPLQRVLRKMNAEEIKALDGTTFDANNVGKKIVPRSERIREYYKVFMSTGMFTEDECKEMAEKAVDNPQAVKKATDSE